MSTDAPEPIPIANMAGIYADMGLTLDEWLDQR